MENLTNNNIDNVKVPSIGNTSCEAILPSVPLRPLDEIEKSIQKRYRSELW